MSELPKNLYRAAQVHGLEQNALLDHGITGSTLMERAGQAAFDLLLQQWPKTSRIAVLCGVGNNGGDAYVLARLAHKAGIEVSVYQVGDAEKTKDDALTARNALTESGVSINTYKHSGLANWDVIVDGLLGTGLQGDVTSIWQSAIDAINRSGKPVLALDIPSGLDADTGGVSGAAVKATTTITFIGLKQGMLTGNGPHYCGELVFNDLAVPKETYTNVTPAAHRLDMSFVPKVLKKRSPTSHKGDFGHVLIIGGEEGMLGAVKLAAEAAARVGAGRVSVATRKSHASIISSTRPEIMSHGVQIMSAFKLLLEKATVVGIGPGLGKSPWADEMFACVLESSLPVVVDADALNLLARDAVSRKNWILTPHPGEAARLLGTSVEAIQKDRFTAVYELQQRFGGVVILKGKGSLITTDDLSIYLQAGGNSGMASGGMGDVLTGTICGLLAQRLSLKDGARVGVCIHSEAGDRAAIDGERGMLASDLMTHLRHLVNTSSVS